MVNTEVRSGKIIRLNCRFQRIFNKQKRYKFGMATYMYIC